MTLTWPWGDHYVGGLQVAMDESVVVGFFERFGHFGGDAQSFGERQAPGTEALVKGFPGNEFHRLGTGLRSCSPISKTFRMFRMVQRGCCGGFAAQACRGAVGFAAR